MIKMYMEGETIYSKEFQNCIKITFKLKIKKLHTLIMGK